MSPKALRLTGTVAIFAAGATPAIASAHSAHHYRIVETQHLALVAAEGKPGTKGLRLINAGVIQGRIGNRAIRGAIVGPSQLIDASTSIVRGTEYDAGGSRSFILHIHFTNSNGISHDRGSGRWTGGTGTYRHARGSFTISGDHPVNTASTIKLKGTIDY